MWHQPKKKKKKQTNKQTNTKKGSYKAKGFHDDLKIVPDGQYKAIKMNSHPPVRFEQNTGLTRCRKKKEGNKQSLQSIWLKSSYTANPHTMIIKQKYEHMIHYQSPI